MKAGEKQTGICDHKGNKYPSQAAMCKAYGVKFATYGKRRGRGLSMKESLEGDGTVDKVFDHLGKGYRSLTVMLEAYGVGLATYRRRLNRGFTLEECLCGEDKTKKHASEQDETYVGGKEKVRDHLGNSFGSYAEMCGHYGIDSVTLANRVSKHWSLKDILETPVDKD